MVDMRRLFTSCGDPTSSLLDDVEAVEVFGVDKHCQMQNGHKALSTLYMCRQVCFGIEILSDSLKLIKEAVMIIFRQIK